MPETRWEQFKKYGAILILVLPVVVIILAFSPIGPSWFRSYIDEQNPAGKAVKPWATQYMYKLGWFYSISLRNGSARKTYNDLIDWYYDDEARAIADGDPWVGMAMFQDAILLLDTGHQQKGINQLQEFLNGWGQNEEVPSEMRFTAQRRIATSKIKPAPRFLHH